MRLEIFTICLDSFPFIACHLPVFNRLELDWHWTIAEGVALNVLDTAWCKPLAPRLSRDGTTAYLSSIRGHPRVTVIQRQLWNGKVEMCNACLSHIKEPCVLMQVDSDEVWTSGSLKYVHDAFSVAAENSSASFRCRYFVGFNLVITTEDTYGNRPGEWVRAWRFNPGQRFTKHEPPELSGSMPARRALGISFDHYAYATEAQVAFKEQYYGYAGAVKHWRRLQAHDKFPCLLRDFFPWVKDGAIVDRLYK